MNWHSYHLFIHDQACHDLFLKEYLKKFLDKEKGLISKFFFIRYWQGGPHIRFRFQSHNPEKVLRKLKIVFADFLKNYNPSYRLKKEQYYQNHTFDGELPDEEDMYWVEDGQIVSIPYKPEYERYGGFDIMEVSETIFHHSSQLALQVIEQINDPNVLTKIILACDFFMLAESQLAYSQRKILNERYHSFWLHFAGESETPIEENLSKIKNAYKARVKKTAPLDLDIYHTFKKVLEEQIRHATAIKPDVNINQLIFSHIHMYNNRIGLPPYYENQIPVIIS
ncbi:thiopeptide-type bacteriocin biosynthesis protein [Bacillus velezensis]|uniref:thiopeptide-type bacteriocin biosynthesis protein n=1 Tax=Bacillus velezensis TaxID=492670 RepID=UPI0003A1F6EF|nr:thiopeptide-type bacteriocin biosynthesis protein [Bacillus velezensis]MDQ8057826.1 thiopeptide-type bacteriocin biosynthesis protein [Bacillus velezensis]